MKDHLLQVVAAAPKQSRRNLAREYLQVYVLRLLQEIGVHEHLARSHQV